MPHINSELLSTRLKLQARQWINDHLNRYLERLQDNFHRRALTAHNSAEQADLLAQHNSVKAGQDEAFRLFSAHITQLFSTKRTYEPGIYNDLDRLANQLEKLPEPQFGHEKVQLQYFCQAVSPISLLAGFQRIIVPLKLGHLHRQQALTMFQGLFIQELGKLYEILQTSLPKQNQTHSLEDWINHSKKQLAEKSLSSQQRALTELRLQRLLKLQGHRNTHQDISVDPSDDELFQSTANIFHKLSNRRRLTPGVLAALNTMQTQVSSIALRDRSAFIHPLHPARQVCRQIFNALAHWDGAESKQRQEFESTLKVISRKLAGKDTQAEDFNAIRSQVDACCQYLVESSKLSDKRNLNAEVGQKRLTRLRRKVHELLDKKTANIKLSASVDNMLYGPMTTIVLYHWLRHGSNSLPLRRSLKLIDDILWYIQPHGDWADLRRAKEMAKDIEDELSEGLQRINYGHKASQALITDLHHLRQNASNRATSLSEPTQNR